MLHSRSNCLLRLQNRCWPWAAISKARSLLLGAIEPSCHRISATCPHIAASVCSNAWLRIFSRCTAYMPRKSSAMPIPVMRRRSSRRCSDCPWSKYFITKPMPRRWPGNSRAPTAGSFSPGMVPDTAAMERSGAARHCSAPRAAGGEWQPCGLSHCSAASGPRATLGVVLLRSVGKPEKIGTIAGETTELLRHAWSRGLNCPRTSSMGRLFDGAAALLGLVAQASYEGQAPSRLEAICTDEGEPIPLPLNRRDDGIWESDWAPLLDPFRR